jgi:uncharacterized membrane protein
MVSMITKLRYFLRTISASIWLIPVVLCAISLLLGLSMLWVDRQVTGLYAEWQMFAMSVDSARQVLSVIAGSVISVAGVSFSVTMVALTLTSGQYGPKILRHFLDENDSKTSLGLFLGAFVYSLVVLTGFASTDKPHLTVIVALLLALTALAGFIRFIHRTATDLQADKIVERLGSHLQKTLSELRDQSQNPRRLHGPLRWRRAARSAPSHIIGATHNGYVQSIDYARLTDWCQEHDCCLAVRIRAGDFVVDRLGIFKAYGCAEKHLEKAVGELNDCIITGPVRTAMQDPEYPITQLNQLAARALSPGINDPGTAITCVDSFSLALAQVVDHELPGSVFLDADDQARLLVRYTSFDGIAKAVFAPLRQFARSEVAVTVSLLDALCRLAELTTRIDRLRVLGLHGALVWDETDKGNLAESDLRDIRHRHKRLSALVNRLAA